MNTPSEADRDAAAKILGYRVIPDPAFTAPKPSFANDEWRAAAKDRGAIKVWEIAGTRNTWLVELRPDTKLGGTYLYCNCPAWPFRKGKGEDCKHVEVVRRIEGTL